MLSEPIEFLVKLRSEFDLLSSIIPTALVSERIAAFPHSVIYANLWLVDQADKHFLFATLLLSEGGIIRHMTHQTLRKRRCGTAILALSIFFSFFDFLASS